MWQAALRQRRQFAAVMQDDLRRQRMAQGFGHDRGRRRRRRRERRCRQGFRRRLAHVAISVEDLQFVLGRDRSPRAGRRQRARHRLGARCRRLKRIDLGCAPARQHRHLGLTGRSRGVRVRLLAILRAPATIQLGVQDRRHLSLLHRHALLEQAHAREGVVGQDAGGGQGRLARLVGVQVQECVPVALGRQRQDDDLAVARTATEQDRQVEREVLLRDRAAVHRAVVRDGGEDVVLRAGDRRPPVTALAARFGRQLHVLLEEDLQPAGPALEQQQAQSGLTRQAHEELGELLEARHRRQFDDAGLQMAA